jgi:uncharacterized protein YbaA (DUF1428 family)
MSYIDGMVAAVPTANRAVYLSHVSQVAKIFKEYGATRYVESWGDDVPTGKVTDFRRAVQAKEDETVVFAWISWPDKAARDAAWAKIMKDERMNNQQMPFDGKRMIYGGFEGLLDV